MDLFCGQTTAGIPNVALVNRTHKTLEQINHNLWMYFGSIVLLLGIVGNSLSLCVLCRRRMRKMIIGTYLITLTISDLVASVTAVLRLWMIFLFEVDFFVASSSLYKPLTFLQNFSKLCSSWMVVTITVERTFLICRPLISVTQRPCFLNPAVVIIIVCIVLSLVVSPELYYTKFEDNICTTLKVYINGHQHSIIIGALYYTFYSFLPSIIIIPCSLMIVLKLRNNQWGYLANTEETSWSPLRASLLPSVSLEWMWLPTTLLEHRSPSTSTSSLSPAPTQDQLPTSSPLPLLDHSFQNNPQNATPLLSNLRHLNSRVHCSRHRLCRLRQNIRIVLIINAVFLATTTPLSVIKFIRFSDETIMFYASQMATLFSDMNIFIDLILFIASGKAFRDELKTLEPKGLRRKRLFQPNVIVYSINNI